ncbi:WD repeat-containing protein 13-like [Hydractinia symbiolongicarpus]|uniref:WD repeat-containing protein 13-like n=1 Tax=Hydractinia symbiolongicarpus TaxID=13093 RepID=UPI00254B441A|nr:WD repeat-containing protein 13-like [Hydractinia symbiolongicarpus]
MNIAQYILAVDVRYNNYRIKTDPQFRTLYVRRRSQLLRDNAKKEHNPAFRRQYLNLRKQLLDKKYGPIPVTDSIRSQSIGLRSRNSSIEASFDNLHLDTYDGFRPTHRRFHSGSSRNFGSFGSLKMMPMTESIPDELLESEGVVPTRKASASRAMAGNTTLSENYSFSGMFHIFDQHADAVTAVKFAHNEKYMLACSSRDCTISICALNTTPPTVTSMLLGHKEEVNDFDWSITNDLLVSASSDGSAQLWNPATGENLRVLKDNFGSGVNACRFMPLNNNLIVTGNKRGHVQVFNMSTGKCTKDGVAKGTTSIRCLEFDLSGTLLWTGDEKGVVTSFIFNIVTGKLSRGKKISLSENNCITSISARTWISREARDPSLLVSSASNALHLYGISGFNSHLHLKASFPIAHQKYPIRSSFCPLMSFRQGACVVTGSEDMSVYFFNIDEPQKPLNTLLGHSSPVLDVCWNYDESLLASCDLEGTVIIWKRQQLKNVNSH